jgi:hypothetical protein
MTSLGVFGINNDGVNTALNVLLLILVVVWIALIFWTFADARRRIDDPLLRELEMTAAEARLANLDYQLCPHCDYEIKADYLRCPSCMRKLKERCYSCGKPIEQSWKICPYCEAETEAPSTPAPSRRRRRSKTTDQPTVAAEAPSTE